MSSKTCSACGEKHDEVVSNTVEMLVNGYAARFHAYTDAEKKDLKAKSSEVVSTEQFAAALIAHSAFIDTPPHRVMIQAILRTLASDHPNHIKQFAISQICLSLKPQNDIVYAIS